MPFIFSRAPTASSGDTTATVRRCLACRKPRIFWHFPSVSLLRENEGKPESWENSMNIAFFFVVWGCGLRGKKKIDFLLMFLFDLKQWFGYEENIQILSTLQEMFIFSLTSGKAFFPHKQRLAFFPSPLLSSVEPSSLPQFLNLRLGFEKQLWFSPSYSIWDKLMC